MESPTLAYGRNCIFPEEGKFEEAKEKALVAVFCYASYANCIPKNKNVRLLPSKIFIDF